MNNNPSAKPYQQLGQRLRRIRESQHQTIEDVANSIEVDNNLLIRIEDGSLRPDEEIMDLLVSHYNIQDQLVDQLYELAGYSFDQNEDVLNETLSSALGLSKQIMLFFNPLESRVIYTDGFHIDYNYHGAQLVFTQSSAKGYNTVSQLGMSYEMLENVSKTIALAMLYRKYLPHQLLLNA